MGKLTVQQYARKSSRLVGGKQLKGLNSTSLRGPDYSRRLREPLHEGDVVMDACETERLHVLHQYGVLDTEREESFDRITRIVAAALDVPMAAVTLIDDHRQWFKSRIGLGVSETPRSQSFCTHTMTGQGPMVVADATLDERFFANPLVLGDPRIRYYAGYPIVSRSGTPLGALCAIDTTPRMPRPRSWSFSKTLQPWGANNWSFA